MIRKHALYMSLLLVSCVSMPGASPAQTRHEAGRPFVDNYLPKEYGAHPQNWSIVQDARGVMFFANSTGALEYDGVSWRLIPGPNRSLVRSFAIDSNHRMYVGGNADFGYLALDDIGQLHFVSLLDLVKEEDRQFGNVWHTFATPRGVYFQGNNHLFLYSPPEGASSGEASPEVRGHLAAWEGNGKFLFSAYVRDVLYVHEAGVGLMFMHGDDLELVPNGRYFADLRVEALLPYDDGRVLVASSDRGLYLYDGKTFQPFASEVSRFLVENQVITGAVSRDGNFAFATMRHGVVMMNKEGDVLQILDKAAGLLDNFVRYIYFDRHGAMWLALDSGIARAETPSPLSVYDDMSGLESYVAAIIRHEGTLYVATGLGVYYLDSANRRFRLVSGITARSWWLLSMDSDLLVATDDGVYGIEKDRGFVIRKSVDESLYAYSLHRSRRDPDRVYVGLVDGLASLHRSKGQWIEEWRINGRNESIRNFVETDDGTLWMGTHSTGVLRMELSDNPSQRPSTIEHFGEENDLPLGGVSVYSIDGKVLFSMRDRLLRFDEATQKFVPDSTLALVSFGGSQEEYSLKEDREGRVWMNFGNETAVAVKQADGSYLAQTRPFLEISDLPNYFVYPEDDGVVWFGSEEMLVRYDPRVQKNYALTYPALIRRVSVNGDSLIFGGGTRSEDLSPKIPQLSFDYNAVRIEYSASSFEAVAENRYQTYLEGFDKGWTAWTLESKRDFTNLSEGEYRFRVRAKNIYQHHSSEADFAFKILPPWYRTWWAYGAYLLTLLLMFTGFNKVRTRKLQARSEELEQTVQQRTAELEEQKLRIQQAYENVEQLSRIGRDITANLSIKNIIDTVYENVNKLMDATAFGIGMVNEEKQQIEFPATKEKGKTLPAFAYPLDNDNFLAVWCFRHQKEVVINDYAVDHKKYIREDQPAVAGEDPESILYLPLYRQDAPIGVITVQSFEKHAYSDYQLNILRNLATYAAIALDNADAYRQLNITLDDLRATQQQLVTQEKLASLGALTAGIAHEIKNPLNFVNNFAELSVELVAELREDLLSLKLSEAERENLDALLNDLEQNARKINEHGKRADSIVRSMLQHSRGKAGERQETDINNMLEEDLNLAYHGMRAQDASFNVSIEKEFDDAIRTLEVVPQDISRVFLNIITNGFYEVHRKKNNRAVLEAAGSRTEDGTQKDAAYSPAVSVRTRNLGEQIEVRIRDNGDGIPGHLRDTLFHPFVTTKPTGQGTGLGLSISYDIVVQEHKGQITFESKEGEFTEFIIVLPRNGA